MTSLLLFGAYANGNIGDTYQAESLGRHLKAIRPDYDLVATSGSEVARDYTFSHGTTVPTPTSIRDFDLINSHDALLIGGGGLLASVHRPLNSETWVNNVKIPIIIAGVGANEAVSEKCAPLLKKAAVVSARDDFSLACFRKYRDDAFLMNDPILADDGFEQVRDGTVISGGAMCLIPRKMTEKNEPVYEFMNATMRSKDVALSMFPTTDHKSGAMGKFTRPGIQDAYDLPEMLEVLKGSSIVVSERFHGCIIALRLGLPTIGLTNAPDDKMSKIHNLYDQIGHPHLRLSQRHDKLNRAQMFDLLRERFDWPSIRTFLDDTTTNYRTALDKALKLASL